MFCDIAIRSYTSIEPRLFIEFYFQDFRLRDIQKSIRTYVASSELRV